MEAVEAAEEEAEAAVVTGTNLEVAVSKVKATLATVPAAKSSRLLKRSLVKATAAENSKDNSTSREDNVERANMIKSLVRVKEVVGETAKQFNLSQKEVLRMASDQFKEEQRQKVVVLQPQLQTRPQVQIKLPTEPDKGVAEMLHKKRQRKSESNNNNNEGEGTTAFSTRRPPSLQILLQSAGSPTPTSTTTVVVAPSTKLKIQQVPIEVPVVRRPISASIKTSVSSSSISTRQQPPSPAPSTSSQRSTSSETASRRLVGRAATPDTKKKSSASASEDGSGEPIVDLQVQHVLEASNKSHVQALLKLRQYKKNLKYAIWDYQDGKPISEAARRYRLPTSVVQYSVDLILRESGQSLDDLLENKDQDVEAASSRAGTSAYEEALRRGIALVKERKAASLLDAAKRAGGLSIFDLTEKLAREVEIESRLRRLQPVEPQEPQININLDSEMLSDIDEVIRDDSAKSHEVAAAFVVADDSGDGGGDTNGSNVVVEAVEVVEVVEVEANDAGVMHMVVEVCSVCTKAFTDNAAYREHEAAGCIDYD